MIKILRLKTLEKMIESKYGQFHSRIFRILEKNDYLNDKMVFINFFFIYLIKKKR